MKDLDAGLDKYSVILTKSRRGKCVSNNYLENPAIEDGSSIAKPVLTDAEKQC